jgi:hypothetical protein
MNLADLAMVLRRLGRLRIATPWATDGLISAVPGKDRLWAGLIMAYSCSGKRYLTVDWTRLGMGCIRFPICWAAHCLGWPYWR